MATAKFARRCWLAALFSCSSIASAQTADRLDRSVSRAIRDLSNQEFIGTLVVEKLTTLPPDPRRAIDAEEFNPATFPETSNLQNEDDRKQIEYYKAVYDRMAREAAEGARYSTRFSLSQAPGDLLRYELKYTDAETEIPTVSIIKNQTGIWSYNHGQSVRYLWSSRLQTQSDDGGASSQIDNIMNQAAFEQSLLTKFGIGDWTPQMMERVQRLKDGRVRAEVNAPDGRWSIILAPFEGTYVLAERERILNSERTYITYSNVTSFSSARIPMAVTYAHGPVNASPDSIERATFRFQVTSVEDPADTSWFSTFQAPEQWTAPDGEVVPISYEIEMEHGTTVARKLDSGISASTEN